MHPDLLHDGGNGCHDQQIGNIFLVPYVLHDTSMSHNAVVRLFCVLTTVFLSSKVSIIIKYHAFKAIRYPRLIEIRKNQGYSFLFFSIVSEIKIPQSSLGRDCHPASEAVWVCTNLEHISRMKRFFLGVNIASMDFWMFVMLWIRSCQAVAGWSTKLLRYAN